MSLACSEINQCESFYQTELSLPKTIFELKKALGMFSYYAKWISDFSEKVRPLVQPKLNSSLPLSTAIKSFETLKVDLASACSTSV